MEKLHELFENPKPWILEIEKNSLYNEPIKDEDGYYHYIYCWVNVDKDARTHQWCYAGMHKSWNAYNEEDYWGSCGNPHYWNSRKLHEYKCIILGYTNDLDTLAELELKIVSKDLVSTYYEAGVFNKNTGGKGSWRAAQEALKNLYSDTNGAPPQLIIAGREARLKKYPETNGVSPRAIKIGLKSAREALERMYPETNGAPPQLMVAGLEARQKKYPDTNGAPPQNIKAAHEALERMYPETNGASPQFIEAGQKAGREALERKYSETNGMPPRCFEAAHTTEVTRKIWLSKFFIQINKNISLIKSKSLDLTLRNYYYNCTWKNWNGICNNLLVLREDPRWTDEMEQLFKI